VKDFSQVVLDICHSRRPKWFWASNMLVIPRFSVEKEIFALRFCHVNSCCQKTHLIYAPSAKCSSAEPAFVSPNKYNINYIFLLVSQITTAGGGGLFILVLKGTLILPFLYHKLNCFCTTFFSSCSTLFSCSSCHFTYFRICSSFSPTVLTQYPLAHKWRPQYFFPSLSNRWKSFNDNLPFKNPITADTEYFGGNDMTKWIWSFWTFSSITSTNSFWLHKARVFCYHIILEYSKTIFWAKYNVVFTFINGMW